jgi:Protein of unknown function (DUF2855)
MRPGLDLLTERGNLYDTEVVESDLTDHSDPGSGGVLLKIDCFGFSANNITYATLGDLLGYWSFFPAPAGYGRVPVWGFADVAVSRVDGVDEGTRVFGFLPPSTHVVVQPRSVGPDGFVDGAEHRAERAAAYNRYTATANDPSYDPSHEGLIALLRPLFMTAFLLDDFLADNGFFGSDAVVITSASSKTAMLLADQLSQRSSRPALVGLTSESNIDFVVDLGSYDRVLAYGEVTTLPVAPTSLIDVAGDATVVDDLHTLLGDQLRYSGIVGGTHLDPAATDDAGAVLGDPRRSLFFAPDQLAKRQADWGPAGLASRSAAAWEPLARRIAPKLELVHGRGPESVRRVYEEVIRGSTTPRTAHVLSMWGDD